jgi:hypothetical protein
LRRPPVTEATNPLGRDLERLPARLAVRRLHAGPSPPAFRMPSRIVVPGTTVLIVTSVLMLARGAKVRGQSALHGVAFGP